MHFVIDIDTSHASFDHNPHRQLAELLAGVATVLWAPPKSVKARLAQTEPRGIFVLSSPDGDSAGWAALVPEAMAPSPPGDVTFLDPGWPGNDKPERPEPQWAELSQTTGTRASDVSTDDEAWLDATAARAAPAARMAARRPGRGVRVLDEHSGQLDVARVLARPAWGARPGRDARGAGGARTGGEGGMSDGMRCPECGKAYRVPAGEYGEHACPRCGYDPCSYDADLVDEARRLACADCDGYGRCELDPDECEQLRECCDDLEAAR